MPDRTGNGLAMRMSLFVEALTQIAEVDLIVVPVAGGTTTPPPLLQRLGIRIHLVEAQGREDTAFKLLARVSDPRQRQGLFEDYGKPSLASFLSAPVVAEIRTIVQACRPDHMHIGRSYLAPSLLCLSEATPVSIDLDEDDRTAFASQAALAKARGDRAMADWLTQEGLACDALIAHYAPRFRQVFVSSRQEARALGQRHPLPGLAVVENAVAIPARLPGRDDGATLAFVGSLSHAPNAEGISWFAGEVLPRLRANGVACRLLVAGAQAPERIAALARHPRISLLGFVPDIAGLYRQTTLALAPLRAGGGTRIKLLEAAAHEVASVATPLGAAGLDWPDRTGGWIAADARQFAQACREALADAAERKRRAALARSWVRRHHAREVLVKRIRRLLADE
jgi:glycosyltransferase involved in cell wall biosynthesis